MALIGDEIHYFYSLHRHSDGREWPARQFSDKHAALEVLSSEAGEMLQFAESGARSGSFTLKRYINQRERVGELLETMLAIKIQEDGTEMPSYFTSKFQTVIVEKRRRG